MPDFSYQAMDRAGAVIDGRLQGDSMDAVAERVRQMGLFPMAVTPARGGSERAERSGAVPAPLFGGLRRVGRGDVVTFTRQLADLVGAGLPLDRCLTVLIK